MIGISVDTMADDPFHDIFLFTWILRLLSVAFFILALPTLRPVTPLGLALLQFRLVTVASRY